MPRCGEDHRRDGGHQQQLDDARLGERDVGAERVDRSGLRPWRGRAACTSDWPQPPRAVSSSQTDVAHSAAPTARCGTTNSADSRDDDVRGAQRDLDDHQRRPATSGERVAAVGRRVRATDDERGPDHEHRHDHAQRPMRERGSACVALPTAGRTEPFMSGKSRIREARVLAGHPRAEQHLGEDRHCGEQRRGASGPAAARAAGIGPLHARSAMKMTRRQDGQRHGQVGRDELGGEAAAAPPLARAATGR